MTDKKINDIIHANGVEITVITTIGTDNDYISLTDMAKHRNQEFPADVIKNWLRLRSTIEFLGLWEQFNNPNFKLVEFDQFKREAGANSFVLSPTKWINKTNAIGMISKSGRYGGGTFAHKDIAFEFASWLSPEFKLYIIKDYQRLKEDESHKQAIEWNVKRLLAKSNYQIHTDAIKANLIMPDLPKNKQGFIYADEADILNLALFGKTAKQWRTENPGRRGNIRDFATIEQLLVLVNLENMNAFMINQGIEQNARLQTLRQVAVNQLKSLIKNKSAQEIAAIHQQTSLPEISKSE